MYSLSGHCFLNDFVMGLKKILWLKGHAPNEDLPRQPSD